MCLKSGSKGVIVEKSLHLFSKSLHYCDGSNVIDPNVEKIWQLVKPKVTSDGLASNGADAG